MIELSNRLQMIASKIRVGSRLADIGSDHALLPVYLAQKGVIASAIAGEYNPGPLEAAKKQVEQSGCSHIIEIREGNGLSVLQHGEANVITIAGMGGALITQILTEGQSKLEQVNEMILQPNVGEELVRHWLVKHNWCLIDENIVLEDGKIYEILHAIQVDDAKVWNDKLYNEDFFKSRYPNCKQYITKERLYQMGPYLLKNPSNIFIQKWESEMKKLERICKQMKQSTLESSVIKRIQFKQIIKETKEVLKCLQMDNR